MVDFDDFVAKAPYEAFLEEKEKEMRNKTEREPSLLFIPVSYTHLTLPTNREV